jgi:hypothetical protein
MGTTQWSDSPVITQCICAWSDLLGFGAALRRGKWDDLDAILPTLDRVVRLQQDTLAKTCDDEFIFMVNDGVARNLDFRPERGLNRLVRWLSDLWWTHRIINDIEKKYGHPGIRTVVVAGYRVTYSTGNKKRTEMILAKRRNWTRQDVEAIYLPEFLDQTAFYVPFEFQMNLAFAKAYALEASGSKIGLSGPKFFLDESVLHFLLSTLNGMSFEFHAHNGSMKKNNSS